MTSRLAVLCLVLLLSGCRQAPPVEVRTYELSGQILVVKPDTRELLIRHGDIVGFMPAMTMPFTVRDEALLEGREAGDLITATLSVAPDAAWISSLTVTGHTDLPADAPAALPAARGVTIRTPGDAVPDTPLHTSAGASMTLGKTGGRARAVTFIYTRCPLPDFCPLMDRRFAEVQRRVSRDQVLASRVSLVSISFDTEYDTPARLAEHARTLAADPAVWQFAQVADAAESDRFAAELGVNVIREADGTITHNLRTYVLSPNGTVVSVHDGNQWTADDILADLRRALGR